MITRLADVTYKTGKRIVITLVGGTVVLLGVAMLVLPGPGMVVIPLGLAILGIEWAWARRFLATIREKGEGALDRVGIRRRAPAPRPSDSEGSAAP